MRKKVIRKVKLKRLSKIIITIFILSIGLQLYCYLSILGSLNSKNNVIEMKLILGWLWLVIGQFLTLHFVWEK